MHGDRRLIARERVTNCPGSQEVWEYIEPDPDAPSVAEVVEAIREARGWMRDTERSAESKNRLDALIARLEGE